LFSAPLRARLRRAPLIVEKSPDTLHPPCGHCGQDGRAPIYPGARPARSQESCGRDGRAPNLPRGVESKVGRAVHCAPGLLVRTRSFGLNPVLRALTSAATSRWSVGAGSTLLISDAADSRLPAVPYFDRVFDEAKPSGLDIPHAFCSADSQFCHVASCECRPHLVRTNRS